MPKIPVLRVARKLERVFRPHDLCVVDNDYHVFVVAYNGPYVEHQHSADEFIYILEGELVMEVEGQPQTLRQGDAVHIPAGTRHKPIATKRVLGMVFERRGLQHGNHSS